MLPNRRQALMWNNADLIHWCINSALGGDELMHTCLSDFLMDHFYNVFLSSGLPPCLHSFPGQFTLWHDNGFQSNIKALYMICKTHWEQWNEELGFIFHPVHDGIRGRRSDMFCCMMMLWHWNAFHITGHLWQESTPIRSTTMALMYLTTHTPTPPPTLDQMAAISQTIFWDAFPWIKRFVF